MRRMVRLMLAGAGLLACAGGAFAAERATKVINVALPDGSVARIQYKGDVAPRVVVIPRAAPVAAADMFAPFAMFDRIAAEMDARMNAMLRHSEQLMQQAPSAPNGQVRVATRTLPPGTVSYSFVSSSNGAQVCGRSVQVTSAGANEKPQVIEKTFGDCAAKPGAAPQKGPAPATAPAPAPDPRKTI